MRKKKVYLPALPVCVFSILCVALAVLAATVADRNSAPMAVARVGAVFFLGLLLFQCRAGWLQQNEHPERLGRISGHLVVAMAAAVVAGVHGSVPEAQKEMGGGYETEYHPDPAMVGIYKDLFQRYKRFGKFVEGETDLY